MATYRLHVFPCSLCLLEFNQNVLLALLCVEICEQLNNLHSCEMLLLVWVQIPMVIKRFFFWRSFDWSELVKHDSGTYNFLLYLDNIFIPYLNIVLVGFFSALFVTWLDIWCSMGRRLVHLVAVIDRCCLNSAWTRPKPRARVTCFPKQRWTS